MENQFEIFRYPVTIREQHLDTFGHVNNAAYLVLLEEARWEFITQKGYGLEYVKSSGMGPTILEITLRFRKEIKLRQQITIESQTISIEKKISTLRQTLLNESGEVCCEAQMTFGLFDTKARKLVTPTPEWLKAIGQK